MTPSNAFDESIDRHDGRSTPIVATTESDALWEESEGQVVNAGWIVLGLGLFWLLVPLFVAVWKVLRTSRHHWRLTDQRLHESRGLFLRKVESIELYRVKDYTVTVPFFHGLFGRGRLVLVTSDPTTPVVTLNAISSPLAVADLLRDCVERCRVTKGVREFT